MDESPADRRTFPPCPRCGSERERSYYCRTCGPERKTAWARANPEKVKAQNAAQHGRMRSDPALRDRRNRQRVAGKFGLTLAQYDELLESSGGACAICGDPAWRPDGRRPSLDHNHETGQLRGVLCANCNVGLGLFRDDTELLRKAIAYLDGYAGADESAVFAKAGGPAKRRRRAIGRWTYESGAGWRLDGSDILLIFNAATKDWTVKGHSIDRYLRGAMRHIEDQEGY